MTFLINEMNGPVQTCNYDFRTLISYFPVGMYPKGFICFYGNTFASI